MVVTGATRGIGRATVEGILERGGCVIAIARDIEALRALEAVDPDRVRGIAAHLENTDQLSAVAHRAFEAFGSIDGLVNCAGIVRYEPVGVIQPDSIEVQIRVNFVAPLLLSQEVAGHMKDRGGAIVNVSSTLSEHVAELTSVYAATKAAVNALTKSFALELAPHGIRVNAVLPGGVDTDMIRAPRVRSGESLTEVERQRRIESEIASFGALHPLGRLGTPAEIANVILAVLDQSWQTGSLVTIDGGLSVR